MLAKMLLGKERRKVQMLAQQLQWNKLHIEKEKARVKYDLLQSIKGPQGLALSFGAGCAIAFAYKNREYLSQLQSLPWDDLIQLATEYGALTQYSQASDSDQL